MGNAYIASSDVRHRTDITGPYTYIPRNAIEFCGKMEEPPCIIVWADRCERGERAGRMGRGRERQEKGGLPREVSRWLALCPLTVSQALISAHDEEMAVYG